jgi:hypothetical protein
MLALKINMSDFIEVSQLNQGDIDGFKSLLLDRLEDGFKEQWENQINENLHSTRAEYRKGMYSERPDENTVVMGVIARKSMLSVDIELGKNAFDEKIGFEKSSKKTMKKDGKGWYLTIPFRHSVPLSVGESGAFNSTMPLSVYKLARQKAKPLTWGDLPVDQQQKGVREGFNSAGRSFPAYTHKSARYEGLVRNPDAVEARGTYFTFRRVSELSDANSFIHPGFVPRGFLQKALNKTNIEAIVRQAKSDFFD